MILREDAGEGVSEVVGEMLMVALVIVLLSVFSAALYNYLPTQRDPSVTILMTNDQQNITLWHKGGDAVKTTELTVIVSNQTYRRLFSSRNGDLTLIPGKEVFDLGSNITVRMPSDLEGDELVRLVTPHAVIFTGKVSL